MQANSVEPNSHDKSAEIPWSVPDFMERFTWGAGNLDTDGVVRQKYIDALQAADRKDYGPLLAFVRS